MLLGVGDPQSIRYVSYLHKPFGATQDSMPSLRRNHTECNRPGIAGAYCESMRGCNKIEMRKECTRDKSSGRKEDTRKSPFHNEMGGCLVIVNGEDKKTISLRMSGWNLWLVTNRPEKQTLCHLRTARQNISIGYSYL